MCFETAISKFPGTPVFNLLARPRCFAEKREAGFHRRIELKTPDGDAPAHFAPAMPLNQLVENVLQRDAVQRIVGMGSRRCHVKILHWRECGESSVKGNLRGWRSQ
jgi:hypothetical protein